MKLSRRQVLAASATAGAGGLFWVASRRAPGSREVSLVVPSTRVTDGAGVNLNRVIGARALPLLDPFLLLDEFQSDDPRDYLAGFPEHPHRGFETVTYMIHGAMEHRDVLGNKGRLGPGSAQWMTAGHGIIHSEMPKQDRGLMWGFQLWVNLPAARKLIAPRYQDIEPARIVELDVEGARVRVVAGSAYGRVGPVQGIDVDPLFLDVALPDKATFTQPTPVGHTAFAFVTDGAMRVGTSQREVRRGELAVLSPGDHVTLVGQPGGARVLLLAGRPLGEPVARRGPFVMNTDAELQQAFADYQAGRLLDG